MLKFNVILKKKLRLILINNIFIDKKCEKQKIIVLNRIVNEPRQLMDYHKVTIIGIIGYKSILCNKQIRNHKYLKL